MDSNVSEKNEILMKAYIFLEEGYFDKKDSKQSILPCPQTYNGTSRGLFGDFFAK